MDNLTVEQLMEQAQNLPAPDRVRLIQWLAETLLAPEPGYGQESDDTATTALDGLTAVAWHPPAHVELGGEYLDR